MLLKSFIQSLHALSSVWKQVKRWCVATNRAHQFLVLGMFNCSRWSISACSRSEMNLRKVCNQGGSWCIIVYPAPFWTSTDAYISLMKPWHDMTICSGLIWIGHSVCMGCWGCCASLCKIPRNSDLDKLISPQHNHVTDSPSNASFGKVSPPWSGGLLTKTIDFVHADIFWPLVVTSEKTTTIKVSSKKLVKTFHRRNWYSVNLPFHYVAVIGKSSFEIHFKLKLVFLKS